MQATPAPGLEIGAATQFTVTIANAQVALLKLFSKLVSAASKRVSMIAFEHFFVEAKYAEGETVRAVEYASVDAASGAAGIIPPSQTFVLHDAREVDGRWVFSPRVVACPPFAGHTDEVRSLKHAFDFGTFRPDSSDEVHVSGLTPPRQPRGL